MPVLQILQAIAIIIAAGAGVLALWTYKKDIEHRQIERLFNLRQKYWDILLTRVEGTGKYLVDILWQEHDDPMVLADIPTRDKQRLLGLFKEVAILVKGNALAKEHAFYLLAYPAIQCEENEHFWKGLNKESIYWRPFCEFAEEMRQIAKAGR